MKRYIQSFWCAIIITFVVPLLGLHFWWNTQRAEEPVRPPFFGKQANYISDYQGGEITHYLYKFGILGMKDRLNESDVLILGSSHVMFGFSAADLSVDLSLIKGRTVRVYNLGVFGDGVGFDEDIFNGNKLERKAVIADIFQLYGNGLSPFGAKVHRTNILGAYYAVYKSWLDFTCDWALDPLIPRVNPRIHLAAGMNQNQSGAMRNENSLLSRYLGSVSYRPWSTGDLVNQWSPVDGDVFNNGRPNSLKPVQNENTYHDYPNSGVLFNKETVGILDRYQMTAIYTLLPFDGYQLASIPANAQPFIPISSKDLTFFDGRHLNVQGRTVATQYLLEGLRLHPEFVGQIPAK